MFNEKKVAQMAAYLLHKRGGRMSHLKLMKLLYLSDRESIKRFETPMSGDSMYSMDNGPILSQTLNLMGGQVRSKPGGWEDWISDKANHEVKLRRGFSRADLGHLSDAEIEILDGIYEQFGHMKRFELADLTHEICPEWKDPKGSRLPISYEDILLAIGREKSEAQEIASDIQGKRSLDALFASL